MRQLASCSRDNGVCLWYPGRDRSSWVKGELPEEMAAFSEDGVTGVLGADGADKSGVEFLLGFLHLIYIE